MADPPPLGLSEQDETKLLADYGVVGPYDRLVEVQAASKFKSDYGDDNVFLTGAVDVDDDDEDQDHLPDTDLDAREELLLPLDALLVKHTNILGAYSSNTLMHNISSALQSAEPPSTTPEAEKANIQYREVLRQGREQEARANYLTSEVGKATTGGIRRASVQRRSVMDLGDDEADTVGEADKLLEAANLFLAQEKYNPDLDTELQDRLKEIREEQEQTAHLTSDDDSDEEEDEELLKARALISKFAAIKEAALAEEETSAESVEEPNPNDAVGPEEPSVPPPLPELVYPLYSYDYEPF
ncbi:hypothetical protein ADEAN_000553600 [Angomonas deanei]|uniref:Uncharacterized protein n=1 Tax=Angomonas deanei TaxID=59799 RepID=A0A7G2CDY1_9TRYP|nr:hypothetical protein ADEAN_000553600 [Angomonas deanei]